MKKIIHRQRIRSVSGFTMMEMIIAVAILVILMAVGFVGVVNHQRGLKRLELNDTAREIFIAAQNHLSMAKGQGVLEGLSESSDELEGCEHRGRFYYWAVQPNSPFLTSSRQVSSGRSNLLYEMLPFASLDDTVRLGGSYVIKFDLETATILKVGYSDQSSLSRYTGWSASVDSWYDATPPEPSELDGQLIGWYAGEDLKTRSPAKLAAPTIRIRNAERLTVEVEFSSDAQAENQKVEGTYVQIIMKGKTSGAQVVVNADAPGGILGDVFSSTYVETEPRICVLDDITDEDEHFVTKWCIAGTDAERLIPGEDIEVRARVYSKSELAMEAYSATKRSNSLFAKIRGTGENRALEIANIRHLENLDASISGYDLNKLGDFGATTAKQIADLSWTGTDRSFIEAIAEAKAIDPEDVQVEYLDGKSTGKGSFAPVTPQAAVDDKEYEPYELTYLGEGKKISNLKIESEETTPAGLFGTLVEAATIRDLELIDGSISNGGGAGLLIGKAEGELTLTNVIAHDTDGDVKSKIKGVGAVGGLVGSIEGGSKEVEIDGCAAAAYVEATGADSVVAGGLIGEVSGSSARIKNSYAGGHTKDGLYEDDEDEINVRAVGTAGGLIGSASGSVEIKSCYATTSVSADTTVGGFVGKAPDATITDCYATGLVTGGDAATEGAFAGSAGAGFTDCQFFEIINEGMLAVGGETDMPAGISAIDEDEDSYNTFFQASDVAADAQPYDTPWLPKHYGSKYPYKSVAGEPDYFVAKHYGDWPSPETLVKNTPTS